MIFAPYPIGTAEGSGGRNLDTSLTQALYGPGHTAPPHSTIGASDITWTVGYNALGRLTGFTQRINGASSTSVSYCYSANGDLVSDGLRSYTYDAEGRLAAATTGTTDVSPTTRYAHNALGQRVFKTAPLYPPGQSDEADPGFMQGLIAFFKKL